MDLNAIKDIREKFATRGYGTIHAEEAIFIRSLIEEHRPANFLELGTASGLSSGYICAFLEEFGGESFTTADFSDTFFGDHSKEIGFLMHEGYKGGELQIAKRPFTISLDIYDDGHTYDMMFVDANHMHPWPTIDTAVLLPRLGRSRIMIHHDYLLFALQKQVKGIGPKYLYDQFAPEHRHLAHNSGGNIFYLRAHDDIREHSKSLAESFLLPWSINDDPFSPEEKKPVFNGLKDRFEAILSRHYDKIVLEAFQEGYARHTERLANRQQLIRMVRTVV